MLSEEQVATLRISGIVERQADAFSAELGLGADEQRRRSAAFTFLVARTVYDLTDDEALGSVVDGGNDFGVDALLYEEPDDGAISMLLRIARGLPRLAGERPIRPRAGRAELDTGVLHVPAVANRMFPARVLDVDLVITPREIRRKLLTAGLSAPLPRSNAARDHPPG